MKVVKVKMSTDCFSPWLGNFVEVHVFVDGFGLKLLIGLFPAFFERFALLLGEVVGDLIPFLSVDVFRVADIKIAKHTFQLINFNSHKRLSPRDSQHNQVIGLLMFRQKVLLPHLDQLHLVLSKSPHLSSDNRDLVTVKLHIIFSWLW